MKDEKDPTKTEVLKEKEKTETEIAAKTKRKAVKPAEPFTEQLDLFSKTPKTKEIKEKGDSSRAQNDIWNAFFLNFFQRRRRWIYSFIILFLFMTMVVWIIPQKSPPTLEPKEFLTIQFPPEETTEPDPIRAKSFYEKAVALYYKDTLKDYRNCIEMLQESLKFSPQDPSALSLLSKSYLFLWELTKKDVAILNDIRKLIDLAKKSKARTESSSIQSQQAEALWHLRKKEPLKALRLIKTAIKKNSFQADSHQIEGEILIAQKSYDAAISSLEKAIELDPAHLRSYFWLAAAYQKKNDPEKAYETFWTLLHLNPEHALSRLEASLIDIQTFNNLKKAQGNLKIVTQFPSLVFPKDLAKAHYHLGLIFEEQKQLDFALRSYKEALRLDANDLYRQSFEKLGGASSLKLKGEKLPIKEESLHFVNIGNQYLEEGEIQDAIAQYKAALQIDSKNHLAYYQLGQVSERQKKWKQGLEYYQKALRLSGTHLDSYLAVAKIHIHYFEFENALKYIEKAKSIEPRSAKIHAALGYYYHQRGEISKAISEYQRAAELDREDFENYYELGSLYLAQKEYQKAEKKFLQAIRYKPDEAKIQTQVAILYFEQGLKSQAVEHLKKLSKAYPLNPQYLNGLGKIYYFSENYSFAKETFLKAIQLDEKNIEAFEALAQTYAAQDEYEKAIQTYQKLITIDPSDAKWYFEQAHLYFQTGDLDKALSHFKKTVQVNYNYPLSHYYVAQTSLLLGDTSDAEREYMKEIQISPHMKEPYLALANLLASQKRFEEAQKYYQNYIRLDPSHTEAYLKLGNIHLQLGRFETAIEFFRTAIEKDPDLGEPYFQLGLIYKHLERRSDAIEAFENYMRVSPDAANIDQVRKEIEQLKR